MPRKHSLGKKKLFRDPETFLVLRVLLVELLDGSLDLCFQRPQFVGDCIPHNVEIDTEIMMHQDMAHTDDFSPRNRIEALTRIVRQCPCGLTNQLQVVDTPYLDEFFGSELRFPAALVFLDVLNGVQNII